MGLELADPNTRPIILDLTAASTGLPLGQSGHSFVVRRASDASANVSVYINKRAGLATNYKLGEGFVHGPFKDLILSWAAQPGVSIELSISGDPDQAKPEAYRQLVAQNLTSVTLSGTPSVNVANFPATQPVSLASSISVDTSVKRWSVPAFPVNKAQGVLSATPTLLHTVTALKKLVIRKAWAAGYSNQPGILQVRDNAGTTVELEIKSTGPAVFDWAGLEIPAGKKIYGVGNTTYTCDVGFTGQEEAA